MILLIDNYDSFVYNLARYVTNLGFKTQVHRNDKISLGDIEILSPSHIILSPGPSVPDNAGVTLAVIKRFSGVIPLLGICLGHQAIGQAFGGKVVRAKKPMHGMASEIFHQSKGLFSNLQNGFTAARYHSLIVEKESLPPVLHIDAWSQEGEIMALSHVEHATYGLQFHPESILSEHGQHMIAKFTNILPIKRTPICG